MTEETLREPPRDLQSEKCVIGSMILDTQRIDDALLLLKAADFWAPEHQSLFGAVADMHNAGKAIDSALLVSALKLQQDVFSHVGGVRALIAECVDSVAVASHLEHYARLVKRCAILRGLISVGEEIVKEAYDADDEAEVLSRSEQRLFALLENRATSNVTDIKDVLLEVMDALNGDRLGIGLKAGYPDIDHVTGGMRSGELLIVAARPGVGKTAIGLNVAEHVAVDLQGSVLFVSLEMSRLELASRLLCSRARINAHKLRNGFASQIDRRKLIDASAELSRCSLFVDDTPNRTLSDIAACARRVKRKKGLALVVIDYLQLIWPDNPKEPRQEQVAKIARRLKGIARELAVPVLCLAQLNRQAEDSKEPRMSHLRESGAIEQDADVVLLMHRPDDGQESNGQTAEVNVAKNRNGPPGRARLTWLAEFTRFESAPAHQREAF